MSRIPFNEIEINTKLMDGLGADPAWDMDIDRYNASADYYKLKNQIKKSNRTSKEIADDLERKANNQTVKTDSVRLRRKLFDSNRAEIVLLMLDSGLDYICCVDGCEEAKMLSVDHIKPVSKGGSDKLSNLQFMCKSHNSAKSDR